MSSVRQLVFVVAFGSMLTGVATSAAQSARAPAPEAVPRTSQEQFRKMHASGDVLVVDVRGAAVFELGHSPGAVSVPLADVERQVDTLLKQAGQRAIVTYCSCAHEQSAAEAALVLMARGVKNVSALAGGYLDWVLAGGKVERHDLSKSLTAKRRSAGDQTEEET
jgi:rhodanese-related sulfurtransferase